MLWVLGAGALVSVGSLQNIKVCGAPEVEEGGPTKQQLCFFVQRRRETYRLVPAGFFGPKQRLVVFPLLRLFWRHP